jgi:uncharacterized ubiquitin-like protein YukD
MSLVHESKGDRRELLEMAIVSVHVWDATGNKRQQVDMPDDAPVNRILAVLLEKMNFPQYAPDGQILSYKFHHRSSGKQLLDDQCLRDVGVKDGDVLRLQPEITAGRNAECRANAQRKMPNSE